MDRYSDPNQARLASGLVVRPASWEDMGGIGELLSDRSGGGALAESRQWRGLQMMLDFPGSQVLVAEQDGRLSGLVTVQIVLSVEEGGWVGLLDDLLVDPVCRRSGIGQALLDAAVDWFRRQGVARAQMLVDGHNVNAIVFCRKREWLQTNLIALRRIL